MISDTPTFQDRPIGNARTEILHLITATGQNTIIHLHRNIPSFNHSIWESGFATPYSFGDTGGRKWATVAQAIHRVPFYHEDQPVALSTCKYTQG